MRSRWITDLKVVKYIFEDLALIGGKTQRPSLGSQYSICTLGKTREPEGERITTRGAHLGVKGWVRFPTLDQEGCASVCCFDESPLEISSGFFSFHFFTSSLFSTFIL
jgi:hypothetical protein